MKKLHANEEGQGLVELVLLVPMFVMLVWGAWFFAELTRERIRVHQAARYAAFASAHAALTKYDGGLGIPIMESNTSNHLLVQGLVNLEMMRIYGDITMPIPGVPDIVNTVANNVLSQRLKQKPNTFDEHPKPLLLQMNPTPTFGASIDALVSKLGGGSPLFSEVMHWVELILSNIQRFALNHYGFNGASLINAYAQVDVTNRMLPILQLAGESEGPTRTKNEAARQAIMSIHAFSLGEQVSVIGDSWALGDGRSVWKGQNVKDTSEISAFKVEVSRLKFLLGFLFNFQENAPNDRLSDVGQAGNVDSDWLKRITGGEEGGGMLDARVTSINYGTNGNGEVDLYDQSNTSHGRQMYPTNDVRAEDVNARGDNFMGCKTSERGACDP